MTLILRNQIQKGDRIRVVFEEDSYGLTRTLEGVANSTDDSGDWSTFPHGEYYGLITYASGSVLASIELLDRPKPPLPTEPGTVFKATEIAGVECDVTVMVIDCNFGYLSYSTSARVDGRFIHLAHNITAWELIDD